MTSSMLSFLSQGMNTLMRSIIIGCDDDCSKLRQNILRAKPDGQRGREEDIRGRICWRRKTERGVISLIFVLS